MKRNKSSISPTFILETKEFDIKDVVCSLITMFSVFKWDSTYKNPNEDLVLMGYLEELEKYIKENYMEV